MFSLHIDRCTFLDIDISFLLELSVWCSCLWSLVCCDASLYAFSLNTVPFVLIALVIVLMSSFLLCSMFTAVKESVCIVILSFVSLAFSSATRMAVISVPSTDAESLLVLLPCVQLTPPPVSRHLNSRYSTCCCLTENGCIIVIFDLCFSISVPSRVQYIPHLYGSCSQGAVSSLCSCVGSSNCLDASR